MEIKAIPRIAWGLAHGQFQKDLEDHALSKILLDDVRIDLLTEYVTASNWSADNFPSLTVSSGNVKSYQTSGGSTDAKLAVSTTGSGWGLPIFSLEGQ